MTTLRNEIIDVKELSKRFVTDKFKSVHLSKEYTNTIEKSVVFKLGHIKVIGLKIEDVKNPRWTKELAAKLNTLINPMYLTEYVTETTWIFE